MRAFADPFWRPAALSGFWKATPAILVVVAASLATRAITTGRADEHWLLVARDSSYSISLDTSRIVPTHRRMYEVWYRTDHAATRFYNEKAFTRELVHAVLRCDNYTFRVMSVAMSMGAARPVVQQTTEPRDLERQEWRRIEPGSTEASAARATCLVADWMK